MKRTGICAAGLVVLGLAFGGVGTASAHNPGLGGPGYFMGPGMMGPGYGMMGPGYGMMDPGYGMMGQGYGMMGPGFGMMGPGYGMMGPSFSGPSRPGADLSTDDVRANLERWLTWQGNPRVKVGDVKEESADVIVADLVTQEGSLVDRFKVDRHSGLMQRVP